MAPKALRARVEGVDLARGLASLLMIQGHAYHGWVAPTARGEAYALTRTLGTLPLPAFLALAGAAVTWRLDAGRRRGQDARELRAALARRGLQLLAYGYLVSFVYALMDGSRGGATLLRSDVLHVIGLSIASSALCVGATVAAFPFALRCLGLGVAVAAACPWVSDLDIPPYLAPLAALFVDAPPYTRMPWVPLFAWFAIGAGAAAMMLALRNEGFAARRAGTSLLGLAALGSAGVLLLSLGAWATDALTHAFAGPLSRAHPAVWGNVVDLAGRGLLVLVAGATLSLVLPERVRRPLVRLGRGSLVAYVVHIPFCYGNLAAPLRHRASMTEATLALIPLALAAWASVYAWEALKARARSWRGAARSP